MARQVLCQELFLRMAGEMMVGEFVLSTLCPYLMYNTES